MKLNVSVPYRRYRYCSRAPGKRVLVVSKEFKSVMNMLEKLGDMCINFEHHILPNPDGTWHDGQWYDQIEVTITDV